MRFSRARATLSIVPFAGVLAVGTGACGSGTTRSATATPPGTPAEIEADLLRLDSIWFAGYQEGDPSLIDGILSADFRGNTSGTEVDRDGILAVVPGSAGTRYPADWRAVHSLGDVALVRARRTAIPPDGSPRSTFVYLDVYAWRDGRWQCVSGQSSPVPSA